MAHNIETIAYAHKQGANDSAYQTPWHGLGVPVTPGISAADMLVTAGLDWTVDRHPTFAKINDQTVYTGKDVLARSSDGRILTHISEGWEPVQNTEFINFYEEFVSAGHMEMNTMGSLKNGEIVWALAKIKEDFSLFGGKDRVDGYLLFSNPHIYGKAVDIRFTAIRVVCNNTLTLALNKKSDMAVRLTHSRKFDAEQVKNTLGISHNRLTSYKEAAEFLASKKFSVDNLISYYNDVFPSLSREQQEDSIKSLSLPARRANEVLETQPGAEFGEGTWWQAFNSVTYAVDHVLGRSQDSRLASAWYGPNRQRKIDALTKAVEYAEAA
jgi:phage/plasmid-like protein (TIGR03299 family)